MGKKAAKYINALDRPTKQRIKAAIEGLTEEPPRGDIKVMQGFTDGRKRLRVGIYINNISHTERSDNMSTATKEVIDLMEILPESEQNFALEFIKKLVLAWDPDFTKLTPAERASLEEALADPETIPHEAINWD